MAVLAVVLLIVILFGAATATAADNQIKEFTTDGCSLWPEGTRKAPNLWHECCVSHDITYWQGGTRQQRRESDRALKSCVKSKGKPITAGVMELGVRLGGHPLLPTRFRWGYGWRYPRRYKQLTESERESVDKKLPKSVKIPTP